MTTQELEQERQVFLENIEKWRQSHMGQFVLIKGAEVLGFFPDLEEAFSEGMELFGLEPFFVNQITPEDSVNVSLFGERLLST